MSEPFNGALLTLARQTRRTSQPELVRQVNGRLSQAKLSKVENGQVQPDKLLVQELAAALRYATTFFYDSRPRPAPPVSFHRKRQKLGSREREAIEARAEVYRRSVQRLFGSVEIEPKLPAPPAVDPDQYDGNAEVIAALVRRRWNLPRGRLLNLTRLMEDAGIIVVEFDFGTPLMDGFCHHAYDGLPPMVFINSSLSADRYRFSLAHELGHLVMHHTPNREMEIQANRFASELLMPSEDIDHQLYHLSVKKFMDLKLFWHVSMQALIYKSWQNGKISDRGFKYYNIEMAKRGFRTTEPVDLPGPREQPSTLGQLLATHVRDLGYTLAEVSQMFGLLEDEVRALYPIGDERPRLRLVV